MRDLIVADTDIRQDAEGRYCLNDLHRAAVASGANSRTKEPGKFMASPQTIELVHELTDTQNLGIGPVNAIKGGTKQGTYVVKELVYAYAMWISPAFHLKVIRAYDRMVAMTNPPFATSNLAHGADLAVAAERTFRSFLRAARSSGLPHARALAVANDKTRERTGLDMLRELGIDADAAAEPDPAGATGEEEGGGRSPLAEAERIARATLRLARAAGLPHARALRQARTVAQERTGVDIFAEIGLGDSELDAFPVAPAASGALSASPQTRTEQIVARLIVWFAQPQNQAQQDITVAEVLTEVLGLQPGQPGWKSTAISAGAALRRLGWRMVDRGSTQKRRRVYCRAAA